MDWMRMLAYITGTIDQELLLPIYPGHLANEVFKESWLFPIALTAIGLGVIYVGVIWQRNEKRITQSVRGYLPSALRELLEEREV